ncbi:MAG: restriction endonuclease subunit S [Ardenticatenales bacterium]|nr:restriction endonuclease subunit S [Ardenticatenales bacterium]
MTSVAARITATGGRKATTRHIPPNLALAVGPPSVPPPKGWQWSLLTDLARLESGHTPSRRHSEWWGGSIPWIGIQDARANHGRQIEATRESTNELGIANSSARVLPTNTVCLSRTASVGYVVVMGRPMATSQDFVNWVCSDQLDHNFLKYLLIAEGDDLRRLSSGSVHQTIYFPEVKAFYICHPSLPEQHRIVRLLDEAFAGIATAKANAERNRENARAVFENHLQSVFSQRSDGWVESRLKTLATKIGSGATPRGGEKSYKPEGVSLIRSLNVHDLEFRYPKLAFLDDQQANDLSNVEVQQGDVLLNITGASVARCCIVPENVLPARVNQHVSIIRPIADKLDAAFLHFLLISRYYKDRLLQTGEDGGSTRQAITKAQIQDFIIKHPASVSEQRSIAVRLAAVLAESQHLTVLYQHKLTALDALKKSLLHQAFTGQL